MASDEETREQNKELIRYYYTHMFEIVAAGIDEASKFKTQDATTSLPFAGATPPSSNDYGWAGMQTVPETFQFWRHEIVAIFDCLDPDQLIVEADAVARTRTLDLDYHQRYVIFLTFRDGKIEQMKEYFNSDTLGVLLRERQHQARLAATPTGSS
jgi:ketosteroid isomerase-like protein